MTVREPASGLADAEAFFFAEGLPRIERAFPEVMPVLAAGLVGEGSECFGMDDERSRDHDGGVGFCVWLPDEVAASHGALLAEALRELPGFRGRPSRLAEAPARAEGMQRVGVFSTTAFYRRFTGLARAPRTVCEWWALPDANLATVTNGKVFCDRLGAFARWRDALLAGCPRDVKLKKMAYCCYIAMQTGQYNVGRMLGRGRNGAAAMVEAVFVEAALRLTYYLNDAYPPFYKWMQPAVRTLPVLGARSYYCSETLAVLARNDDGRRAAAVLIGQWCDDLMRALGESGLVEHPVRDLYEAAVELHSGISDEWLRSIPLEIPC